MLPEEGEITNDAKKRLEAIELSESLGGGFTLASHDMEIRGAGELLGEDQSGQIESVGFSLYMELLDRAVKALERGELPDDGSPLTLSTKKSISTRRHLFLRAIFPIQNLDSSFIRELQAQKQKRP